MNGYITIFHGRKHELYANSLYEAKKLAVQFFKPKKKDEHSIIVLLCEKDGMIVTHSTGV
jgi:hypothetical protein